MFVFCFPRKASAQEKGEKKIVRKEKRRRRLNREIDFRSTQIFKCYDQE
jgi:hypothetical protein